MKYGGVKSYCKNDRKCAKWQLLLQVLDQDDELTTTGSCMCCDSCTSRCQSDRFICHGIVDVPWFLVNCKIASQESGPPWHMPQVHQHLFIFLGADESLLCLSNCFVGKCASGLMHNTINKAAKVSKGNSQHTTVATTVTMSIPT